MMISLGTRAVRTTFTEARELRSVARYVVRSILIERDEAAQWSWLMINEYRLFSSHDPCLQISANPPKPGLSILCVCPFLSFLELHNYELWLTKAYLKTLDHTSKGIKKIPKNCALLAFF